ncbi:MAG: right-handed parallel beta-helix repeat-containing protein [Psychromonas sp.]
MKKYALTNNFFSILFFLALFTSKQAASEVYYVSPDGDNSNTGLSVSEPIRTISSALNRAYESGDIIYVMTGTYVETAYIWQDGITLSAYPGHTPVIDGQTTLPNSDWGALIGVGGNHNTISGFELKNSNTTGQKLGGYGINVDGHHNTISKIKVHHIWEQGIIVHGDFNTVEDSIIWQAALQNASNSGQSSGWAAGLSAARNYSPSALQFGITSYATFRRNTVFNNWGEGISCYEADHCTIENNTIYDNWTANLYLSDAKNSLVRRNLIYISSEPAIPIRNDAYIGILLADEVSSAPRSAYNKVKNNLLYNADFSAFNWTGVDGSGLNHVLIAKNIIVDGSLSTGGPDENVVNTLSVIKNNIITGYDNYIPDNNGLLFLKNNWSTAPALGSSLTDSLSDPQISRAGKTTPGDLTADFFTPL